MNLLTMEKITKSYTDKILFNEVTLGISEGDKIGVIGVNGTGKSTLLKMIAGLEYVDKGNVTKGSNIKIEYLAQTPEFDNKLSILENVLKGISNKNDIWNKEGEAKSMLNKLGIADYSQDIDVLSGGQRKRVALVRTLLNTADILVLDEPTNHLDNEMAEWLENYLNNYKGAFIMVTHDRYFLDEVVNKIIEIDKGNIYSYPGNYSDFLELKAQREDIEVATERKNKSLYRIELEWIKRGARARSTKQKARIERFNELKDRKGLDESEAVVMNSVSKRLGKKTVEINSVSKTYEDKKLFKDFTYIMLKGDRIGIIGKNGCGKSTLLKVITGLLEPDSGNVDIGTTVKIGYFSQENEYMDDSVKVIDFIKEVGEYIQTKDGSITASQMLERFLFCGSIQYSLIGKLSGGEKRRLNLLRVLMEAPNILILDEPTNDLDIQTLTILENYLDEFPGIVLTVSHDRYFLDRVVKRIFAFEENGVVKQYEGGFTDYKNSFEENEFLQVELQKEKTKTKEKQNAYKTKEKKLKFTFNEQREYEMIDEDIAKLEESIEKAIKDIEKNVTNYSKLNELTENKNELELKLEEKMDRWVYLNDLAEQIEKENNGK